MLSDFISLFYPSTCLNCNETLISAEKSICTSCKIDLPETNDHLNSENELFQKFAFEPLVKSAMSYLYFTNKGITQQLIHSLKYEGDQEVGRMLGSSYGKIIQKHIQPDIILPVPLHKKKMRKRGYNQSLSFALGLSEYLSKAAVREDLVTREKHTPSQTRQNKVSRWVNVSNIYSEVKEDLTGKNVLIVDDVVTTGATIGMLCTKLRERNVESINIACIGRR